MKKGFTLIELLAVILILGIIALIAIPTVTNIINESKMQSFVRSAEGLLSSIDTKINIDMLKGEDINVAYNFKDGKLLNGELDLKGNMPKEGKIRVNNDGEVKFAIVYDKYCLTKSFDSDEINANELDENECQLPDNESKLKNYGEYVIGTGWVNKDEVYYVSEYRKNIISVNFLYQESVPTNALISWDVSDAQDESIMAYLMPNGTKYDLYIISENNIRVLGCSVMFKNFISLEKINFNNFNTKYITNFQSMFDGCVKLESLDLTGFDTSGASIISTMFRNCESIKTINLNGIETSNVTNMSWTFEHCHNLESLDLSSFDTSKVTNMEGMFYACHKLINLNISSFNTSSVSNMGFMFTYCGEMSNINLSNFNTSNCTAMTQMFRNCSNLTTLDLSKFDTRNVTNMDKMFQNSKNLTTIYKGSNWVTADSATDMFSNCGTEALTLK